MGDNQDSHNLIIKTGMNNYAQVTGSEQPQIVKTGMLERPLRGRQAMNLRK